MLFGLLALGWNYAKPAAYGHVNPQIAITLGDLLYDGC